jgi:hypothetical protein
MGLFDGLRTTTKDPVQVATQHIPFVETLWMRLVAAREQLAAKEDYLRQVGQLSVRVDSLTRVADGALADSQAIRKAEVDLDRIKKVLAFGCEPTTPPEWFCGHLTAPKKVKAKDGRFDGREEYPSETWPQWSPETRYRSKTRDRDTHVYTGPMPAIALQRYAAVKSLIDDVRVYSPRPEDFETIREDDPSPDPVLIGMIAFLGEPQYFEIARWDIDKDLAAIFGSVSR